MKINTNERTLLVDLLSSNNISYIKKSLEHGDAAYLDAVLRGDGHKSYNLCTDEEIIQSVYEEFSEDDSVDIIKKNEQWLDAYTKENLDILLKLIIDILT